MTDKQPMQASGGAAGRPDGVGQEDAGGSEGAGQSAGGAYARPEVESDKQTGVMGHGGQSEMDYHGTGQLGEEQVGDQANENAPTR